jgi:hypothetical protein
MAQNGRIQIDGRKFLVIDGLKVCKVTAAGLLEFKDKSADRSQERGSRFIYVSLEEINQAIQGLGSNKP